MRKAILSSAVPIAGVEHGRVDAARAVAALDGTGGGTGALKLSREALSFTAKAGRIPRAQTVSVRADVSPWRLKQIRRHLNEMAAGLGTADRKEKDNEHDRT